MEARNLCPNCGIAYHPAPARSFITGSNNSRNPLSCSYEECPSCGKPIVYLNYLHITSLGGIHLENILEKILIVPQCTTHRPLPNTAPEIITKDFTEAESILKYSPNASAALARRCLQHLIRTQEDIHKKNLTLEIQHVIDNGVIPPFITRRLNTIRRFGNIAAHANLECSTGEIVDVEPDEASYILDTIDLLFNYYFIEPQRAAEMEESAKAKVSASNKPSSN